MPTGTQQVHLLMDIEFSLLKTSIGMSKRYEYFKKVFGLRPMKQGKASTPNIEAIKLYYDCSTRMAHQYYDLICSINKSGLMKIRRAVGLD